MSSGPQNFLNRINKELASYGLPPYEIINPNPSSLNSLKKKDIFKVGRLDGASYYKTTSLNFYNLIKQRREKSSKIFSFLPYFPNKMILAFNKPVNYFLNRASKEVQKKSDIIIFQSAFSKDMQDKFVGSFYIKKPHKIILNGIPRDVFYPPKKVTYIEGFPNLAITASFRLHKRLQDAIAITNFLKKKYPDIRLHILGNMDNLTKKYISMQDISSCVFHGNVKTIDLPRIYSSCDVGLSPSLFDPCPNSVIEMMGCGLPVITTSQSGAKELVKNSDLIVNEDVPLEYLELQTAHLIPQIDIKAWSGAIEKIIDQKLKYSEFVLKRVEEELDIKITAKKYAQFIMENIDAK
ncbi:MAG: UDP-glucose:(heptosyl)LPS alpha,3-glucosyltransferase [Campylobacterota bacterium]|nr:UDP-glucose:(heptosyl)LPS alpha,3-glucosyltransferase [Campylobacterota bacterium]